MKLDREKLIRFRERCGYTVRALAEEGGLSTHTIVRAEGSRDVTPTTARKLASALGVSVADLVREPEA